MTGILGPSLAAALLSVALAGGSAFAQTAVSTERAADATTLDLSAHGEIETAPDQATIILGVQMTAPTAGEAIQQDARRMAQVIAALKKAGLPDKAIRTSNLSLNASYSYVQNQPPKLVGYQASNDVAVTIDDLGRLGAAVDASVAAGADQVNGVSFGLKDPRSAEDSARKAAVAALQAKAELYAEATGYHLRRLVNLTEGGGYQPGPVRPVAMMKAAMAAPTPIEAGQLTIRIDISGVYELAK